MIDALVEIILYVAGIFAVLGAIGMIRFPDFYTRAHAATLLNVGGITLALLALLVSQAAQMSIYSWKILFVIILMFVINPTTTHALAHAAQKTGVRPRKLGGERK